MECDGRGGIAETRLYHILAGIALCINMEADHDFATVALFEVGRRIDEVLRDVLFGDCRASNGLGRCHLRFDLQPIKEDEENEKWASVSHSAEFYSYDDAKVGKYSEKSVFLQKISTHGR